MKIWNAIAARLPLALRKHVGRRLLALTGGLTGATPLLAGDQYFDDKAYTLAPWGDVPMNTIAGLTEWARSINNVYLITTIIVTFVFFAVSVPLVVALMKFRVKEEDLQHLPPPKQVHGNAILEFTWTIVPVILLLFIAVPTWEAIFSQPEEAPEGALQVNVIGHQWWWEFQYPSLGVTTANELHLPADTPVFFTISSADVIHSFWIPKFGGKIDAFPGAEAQNHLFFTTPPVQNTSEDSLANYYQGQCVELCGPSHALMRFQAVIHSQEDFSNWAKTHNEPPVIESELAKKGEAVFMQCQSCHTIAGTPSEELEKQMLSVTPPVGKIGPNLSNFGSRRTLAAGTRENTEENLHRWIKDPQAMKPGALMTKLPLSDDDIRAVAAYIRHSTAKTY